MDTKLKARAVYIAGLIGLTVTGGGLAAAAAVGSGDAPTWFRLTVWCAGIVGAGAGATVLTIWRDHQ